MTQTQQELERLRTLQESYHDLDDKINVVLPALADKIDNIQFPEIDTTELAKEETLKNITNEIVSGIMSRVNVEVSYDGFTTSDGSVIKGGIDLLKNKGKVIKIVDDTSTKWNYKS